MRHAAFCTPLDSLSIAGSGLGNVTLGIPRMRELLMTASAKPKTPYMRLALRPEQSSKAKAEELARRWTKITFIELLHEIASAEQVGLTAAADALASVRSAVLVCTNGAWLLRLPVLALGLRWSQRVGPASAAESTLFGSRSSRRTASARSFPR